MKITSQQIKDFAREAGVGDIGIANIERFKNAPKQMHPKNIFPDCKSVITIVQQIPRGSYRGITEGTHWPNYTYYSYNRLNTLFRDIITYNTSCFIEDHGFEAVPIYPGVCEAGPVRPSVAPDRPAPDVNLQVRIVGMACGVGEMGWSKVFINPKFGPRVRLGTILTDAELEPDPLVKPGTYCNRCGACAKLCPGNAIPDPKDPDAPTVKVQIDDTTYEWGDVHMGRCTLTHHGLNYRCSPFLKKDSPGFDLDVHKSHMSEEEAYKMAYPIALGRWYRNSPEFGHNAVVNYYNQIIRQISYFAICGARGCIRACAATQEARKNIGQDTFPNKIFTEKTWDLPQPKEGDSGGIAEGKFPEDYNVPDLAAGSWK